jgi:hypothetical protein
LAIPPDKRGEFLSATCGDDDALLADVRALLAAHERAGDFLKT